MAKDKGRKAVEKKARALGELTVEYVPIMDVNPNAYNPNRQSEHDFELLVRSMREDGFTQPIIVQSEGMTIVDGEHRWRAARELGHESIPIVKVDMTIEQMKISTLRHNRARGSEDVDLVAEVLKDLRELGALDWAQDSLMLDEVEMERLLEDVAAPEGLAADEFAEGWEPAGSAVVGEEGKIASGNIGDTSMTAAAADALRAQEKKVREATTEEERKAALKDRSVYRVSLVFTADEAATVKKILEPSPAKKLLAMCLAEGDDS